METLKYYSTRGDKSALTSAEAIKRGIAPDGGLYMPETIPTLTEEELVKLLGMNYSERAFYVLSKFLNDYDPETLKKICEVSYSKERFGENAAPVVKLSDGKQIKLKKPLDSYDNLPMLELSAFCEFTGYKYEVNENRIDITTK